MIKQVKIAVLMALALMAVPCAARQQSPNGKLWMEHQSGDNGSTFVVRYEDGRGVTEVMRIPVVGIMTSDGRGGKMTLKEVGKCRRVNEEYTMLTGKRRECSNRANEYVFTFADQRSIDVRMVFRLYDDGVAFRYEMDNMKGAKVTDEMTTFRIAEGTRRWISRFKLDYESFFPAAESGSAGHWAYPVLVEYGKGVWSLLSEANIRLGHSASSLKNEGAVTDYKVTLAENKGEGIDGDWVSPWRVLIVGSLADVVESTLITDVSDPNLFPDAEEWVKPGCASWVYWAYNRGSKDFKIVSKYIDMAHKLSLPYVLIDWEWDIMGNGGTIDDAWKMANERNVRTLVWYNSSTAWTTNGAGGPLFKLNKPEDREKEFAWLEEKGVAGVKIDFFEGDTRATMDYCIGLLECAARHKLLVNFHGATIPRGWQRTYPNFVSAEAVYGAEWYNNAPILTNRAAGHNATLPFTRNVIGSMDYTPCTFSDSQHPHITSHAHELALTVLFESGVQHFADRPESYLAQPQQVQDFMTGLPSVWDDTKLLSGYPASHAVMARRNGDTWYVGGINGLNSEQELKVDLSFLPKGKYNMTVFADSGDKANPWNITTLQSTSADREQPIRMNVAPRGGVVIKITK